MIHVVRMALYGVLTEREGTDGQVWPGVGGWESLAHPCEFQLEMDFSIFPAQEVFAPHQLWEMGGRIHTNPGK